MESPQKTVVAKLSRLRISGVTPLKQFRDLSTPELVIIFYELAEKWDVACCMPNCTKTKDRFKCVKAALRSMDAVHLQPSIKQVKAIKTDLKSRKLCTRALEVMIENLESRYGEELYTRTDWPKPEITQPSQLKPVVSTSISSYTFSPDNFGANDIPPNSSNTFPEYSSKENVPTPPPTSHISSMETLPLTQTSREERIQASNIVNIKRTASSKDTISNGFFPMDRTEEKRPTLNHMFSRGVNMEVDPPVGRKRSRRLSDLPVRKKPSISTSDSSQAGTFEESPSSQPVEMDLSAQGPTQVHHAEASPPRGFHSETPSRPQEVERIRERPELSKPKPQIQDSKGVDHLNSMFKENLDLIGKTLTQTIEVVGVEPSFLHSKYGSHVRRVLNLVFARLQDYDVQEVSNPDRLLWKIKKPIPKHRWRRLKETVKEAAVKIANCVPSNFDSSLKKSILKTAEQIDIKDHEFQ